MENYASDLELILTGNLGVNESNNHGVTELHRRAIMGDIEAVHKLLCVPGINVNIKCGVHQLAPIHFASQAPKADTLIALLNDDRVDVNVRNSFGWTCLHAASMAKTDAPIKALLADGRVDVNARDQGGRTCLHTASQANTDVTLKALLADGRIDVHARDQGGRTCLHTASEANTDVTLKALLADGRIDTHARTNKGWTCVHFASQAVTYAPLKALLSDASFPQVDMTLRDEINDTFVHSAVSNIATHLFPGNVERLELMRRCKRLNHIWSLSGYNDHDVLSSFIGVRDYSKFQEQSCYAQCINILLAIPEIAANISRALPYAVEFSTLDVLMRMFELGGSIMQRAQTGETLLHLAIKVNSPGKVEYLLSIDTSLTTLEWNELTPLKYAMLLDKNSKLIPILRKHMDSETQNDKRTNDSMTTSTINIGSNFTQTRNVDLCKLVAQCDAYQEIKETKEIAPSVKALLEFLSQRLHKNPRKRHLAFIAQLVGSAAEGTRNFHPNELDFICELIDMDSIEYIENGEIVVKQESHWFLEYKTKELTQRMLSKSFYQAISSEIKESVGEKPSIAFGKLHLLRHSFIFKSRISCLTLLWYGDTLKEMEVSVDLVPAFYVHGLAPDLPLPCAVYPAPRYHLFSKWSRKLCHDIYKRFHISHACAEVTVIKSLPRHIRRGYQIAKALRIAAIARPANLASLHLAECISVEDFVTSYMLKTCLILLLREQLTQLSEFDWAESIYVELEKRITARCLPAHFSEKSFDYVFSCWFDQNSPMDGQSLCCLKRRVMLALISSILDWLRVNKYRLERIRDVKLLAHTCDPRECTHSTSAKQCLTSTSVDLVDANCGKREEYSRQRHLMKSFLDSI